AELLRAMQLRDPGAFWTSHQLARELTRLGRWAEGAAFYRVAAALRPDDVPVLHELGAALLEAGDGDGALEVWRHALRIEPGDVRAYHLLLDTLHKLGKLELTIAQLRKDAATDEPWPRVGLALALMVREDWETAIEVLEEAVALWPRDAGLRCHLGDAFLYSGCREDALSQFSLALEFDADCAPATEGVYSLRMAEGDHAGMETLARDLIRLDPTVALNHGKLGQALFLQGRSREAAEAFRRGLEREEDQPILHLWLARSLMCIGDNAGAIRQLLVAHDYAKLYRARDFQPSHRPEFDPVTGIRTHRIQLGMRDLEEALDSRLATAYARKGDPLSACKWLREHLKRHPDCPDNRFFLGFFLLQTGDAAAAASELRAVLEEHDVSNPFILAYTHYHLGFALLATGEAEDGRCHLLRYGERMQRYPDWTPPSSDWERDCAALESLARRLPLLMEDRSSLESAHQTFLLGCLVEATGYPLMAAECYRDAFEQDPDLKKYSINGFFPYNGVMNGAASALRAAWGVGRDSTALDDAERARWRRQSLRWFEDDLAIWQERVRVGAPVEEKWLALYLADWGLSDRYTENSLARDLENLSLLPTDEREEWQAFWDKAEAVHASLAKN
ncbi:MAG: tetratricopeptide repeat protein, partial [Planctomycetota bacterium]